MRRTNNNNEQPYISRFTFRIAPPFPAITAIPLRLVNKITIKTPADYFDH